MERVSLKKLKEGEDTEQYCVGLKWVCSFGRVGYRDGY
jgi:hypothetical protein